MINIIESRRDDSVVQNFASTTEAYRRDAEDIGIILVRALRFAPCTVITQHALRASPSNFFILPRPISPINSVELSNLCYVFPIGARQGALKVTPHGAKRSVGIGKEYIKIESRRDDSVVQNIASTTDASHRDGEDIGIILVRALRFAPCTVITQHVLRASPSIFFILPPPIRPICPIWLTPKINAGRVSRHSLRITCCKVYTGMF